MKKDVSAETWNETGVRAQRAREMRGDGSREMTDAEIVAEVKRLRAHLVSRDWDKESPFDAANMLMNIFGQSPLFGYGHPLSSRALNRIRETIARVSTAVRGVFI